MSNREHVPWLQTVLNPLKNVSRTIWCVSYDCAKKEGDRGKQQTSRQGAADVEAQPSADDPLFVIHPGLGNKRNTVTRQSLGTG